MESKLKLKWIYLACTVLLVLLSIYVLFLLRPVLIPVVRVVMISLLPFLLGGFFAYLLHPLVKIMVERGLPRTAAILVIYILFFSLIGVGLVKGTPVFIHQLKELSQSAPALSNLYERQVTALEVETLSWPDGVQEKIHNRIIRFEQWLSGLVERFMNMVLKAVNFLLLLAIVPFISFYLLKDASSVKKIAWKLTPKVWRTRGVRFVKELDRSLGGYIRGQLFVCLLIGTTATLLFTLIGLKYAVLLGLVIGFTNVIPYFGPIIGAIPALFVALTISVQTAIYAVIIVFALQFLEGNVLSPWIVGKSVHLHPLIIIGALLIGGEAGGVIGLIAAVPILIIIKSAFLARKRMKGRLPEAVH
ncbi:AI-2E family transporter [Bacillus thermotolerans]|uniref:AI-2E family transporter n=1 Tax=Bacillus thermotolerans TaxID=1221996 RepID=UPI00057F3A0D|nr:AI-2E family transporter [Bacillus thermotolerans]KKB36373.1 Membrane protein YrrI [Bacillus thermotolerans]